MNGKRLLVGIAFALVVSRGPARGESAKATADGAAAEAEALAKAGDFTAAAAKFRDAWTADTLRSELFCNIGISYYKAKDLVRAHLLLGQCLEQAALDPKIAAAVRTALDSVEHVLRTSGHTPVRIAADPPTTTLTIAELLPDGKFVGSRVVWLAFGTYHITGHADGYADATDAITTVSTTPQTVAMVLRKSIAVPVVTPPQRPQPAAPIQVSHPSRIPAIALTAVTAVATGVAAFAWVEGRARADLAANALDIAIYDEDRRAVKRWNVALVANAAVAGVAAIASGYAWYRALHVEPRVEVQTRNTTAVMSFVGQF